MNNGTTALTTSRLRLVPATPPIVDAELEGCERLAGILAVAPPPDWPPEHHDVVPSWPRRGLATEACRALIESAWERGAKVIIAHTFDNLEPSIGVLSKLAFARSEPSERSEPSLLAFTLRRD